MKMFQEQIDALRLLNVFPLQHALQTVDSTKINQFLDCPRQYFYSYVLGWKSERTNNHLVFGQAWHEAMEHMLLHGYTPESVTDAYEKFLLCYRAEFPESTDEMFKPKTPANALRALLEYALHYQHDFKNFRVLHTEVAGHVSIDHRAIAFRMDSICENVDGALFSLEHKTKGSTFSRSWTDQWAMSFQAGTYTHVLHCLAVDRPVKNVTINGVGFAAKGPSFLRVPVARTPVHMQNWLFHARHFLDRMEDEMSQLVEACENMDRPILTAFPQNPQACTKYFGCEFYDYCSAWGNPLQHAEKPPIGYCLDHWNPLAQPSKLEVNV